MTTNDESEMRGSLGVGVNRGRGLACSGSPSSPAPRFGGNFNSMGNRYFGGLRSGRFLVLLLVTWLKAGKIKNIVDQNVCATFPTPVPPSIPIARIDAYPGGEAVVAYPRTAGSPFCF